MYHGKGVKEKENEKKKRKKKIFCYKQKTAYEIYQCDWSSDVCSSDLIITKIFFNLNSIRYYTFLFLIVGVYIHNVRLNSILKIYD